MTWIASSRTFCSAGDIIPLFPCRNALSIDLFHHGQERAEDQAKRRVVAIDKFKDFVQERSELVSNIHTLAACVTATIYSSSNNKD